MSLKRWMLWIPVVALLLAADTWATWRLATRGAAPGDQPVSSQAQTATDPIGEYRLEREQLRARETAQLNEMIHSDDCDEETAALARRRLLELTERTDAELTIEGVLQARGFDGAVVTVSGHSANVLVRREVLTQRETSVILELVMRETGLTGGNVKIIPVK